jgi:hypothetical protein
MEIWNDEYIMEYPIQHKALMHSGKDNLITIKLVKNKLGIDFIKVKTLIKKLESLGYIQEFGYPLAETWIPSVRGKLLANTSIKHLLTPKMIMQQQKILIERIENINSNKQFIYNVTSHLFKVEYVKGTEQAKFIHLNVALTPKEEDEKKFSELEEQRRRTYKHSFQNIVEQLFYPRQEIINFLRFRLHNVRVSYKV